MARQEDDDYISVGGWMWILFVTALPCIGLIMMIVWAFTGNNQTRKNYFRAIFAWFFLLLVLMLALALLGQFPEAVKTIEQWLPKAKTA